LRALIAFEKKGGFQVDMDTFSMAISNKFDQRMDLYEEAVLARVKQRNLTQGILTGVACLSVFLVWWKVRSLKKKLLL
jgi:hypothetical protein